MKKSLPIARLNFLAFLLTVFAACNSAGGSEEKKIAATGGKDSAATAPSVTPVQSDRKAIDTAAYNRIIKDLANNDSTGRWPAKAPYPLPGAVLPFNRIVAFTEIYILKEWAF